MRLKRVVKEIKMLISILKASLRTEPDDILL